MPCVNRRITHWICFVAATFAAASMWFYVQRILIPHEIADAVAHARPRGNLSDLYPRWLGARELLLNRINPYSDQLTVEIQKGYYGRPLDPARLNDPKDQESFAYPVYVVFLLSPLIGFSFPFVHTFFSWLLMAVTTLSVWVWMRALRWRLDTLSILTAVLFTVGSFPAAQGIKLQQLSLLLAAMLSLSLLCITRGHLTFGGVFLAFATIKPQLTWPLVSWLLFWWLQDWKSRRNFFYGFGGTMVLLLAASEIVLPGWWQMFVDGLGRYHHYTQNQSVLDQLLPWAYAGEMAALFALVGCVRVLWRLRSCSAQQLAFGYACALTLALTVLVVPMYAPYNQVLLLPAVFLLLRDRSALFSRSRGLRFGYLLTLLAVGWQWLASAGLTIVYLAISRQRSLSSWNLPFYATFAIPILIFTLTILNRTNAPNSIPYPKTQSDRTVLQLSRYD